MFMKLNKRLTDERIMILLLSLAGTGVILFCFGKGISGNDYWWHLKVGEWVVENGSVPTKDVFSWIGIRESLDWIPHEWLSGVILFSVYRTLGHYGIYFLSLAAALIFYHLLLWEAKRYFFKNFVFCAVFFIFLSVIICSFFYPRPHIFSFFCLFFVLKILYKNMDDPDSKWIYAIPPITILWSNLHSGYAMLAYTLCIVALLCTVIPFSKEYFVLPVLSVGQKLRLLSVSVLSAAAIMVNPLGYKALLYPYINQTDSLMVSVIQEWKSPDAKVIGELLLYFLPVFLILTGFVMNRRKTVIIDFAFFCLFVYLFLRSVRFIMPWYIFAIFGGLRTLPEWKTKKIQSKAEKAIPVLAVFGMIGFIAASVVSIVSLCEKNAPISSEVSSDMITYVKEDAPEKIFNDYDFGGELIFNDIPVFFDSRADLYAQESIMKDGISLLYYMPETENDEELHPMDIIEKYHFDRILVKKSRGLYSYLLTDSQKYPLLKEDNQSAYFAVDWK